MNMFTGKAKKLFEDYLDEYYPNWRGDDFLTMSFYNYNFSMQWGVIEDFADSLGLSIEISRYRDSELIPTDYFEWDIIDLNNIHKSYFNENHINSRYMARLECINKLNDILNLK